MYSDRPDNPSPAPDVATQRPETLTESPSGVIETLQSLIVAFVLAMTFRGFVAEGFVIPTGSMAPTLLGQHLLIASNLTGSEYAIGLDQLQRQPDPDQLVDPMIGPNYALAQGGLRQVQRRPRMGDRILVLKGLYAFSEPQRFDVVVFKNPTDPKGESQNYIKRLIGLPNETVWLADGDVFTKRDGEDEFRIRRKPLHVQRALWQPIHHSDYEVVNPTRTIPPFHGPPWDGEGWDLSGRSYRTERTETATLSWNSIKRELDDWTTYNMLAARQMLTVPVSDLRIAAGIVPDQPGMRTKLELLARSHVFEFTIADGEAIARYRPGDQLDEWIDEKRASIASPEPGRVINVEFWHADQAMRIFIDRREVVTLKYEWSAQERLEYVTGLAGEDAAHAVSRRRVMGPELRWSFAGSPVTLHRVRVDRDLYYRAASLDNIQQRTEPFHNGPAFGTHPDALAVLGPDHYYMLGDNSQASLDSRLWGSPHELVAEQIDDSPFVVHRKLMLGKAWVVYFPAPYSMTDGGVSIIPDFGRLRYIR
jgi:signal peptidase I